LLVDIGDRFQLVFQEVSVVLIELAVRSKKEQMKHTHISYENKQVKGKNIKIDVL